MKKMYMRTFFLPKKHQNPPQLLPLFLGVILMLLPFIGKAQATKVTLMPSSPYTSNYTGTWTVPAGVYAVTIECIGGGGGGASGYNGGGGGGYSFKTLAVSPNQVLYIQAGAAGAGGTTTGNSGSAGSQSFVKLTNSSGTTIALANGGGGGNKADPGPAGDTTGTGDIFLQEVMEVVLAPVVEQVVAVAVLV